MVRLPGWLTVGSRHDPALADDCTATFMTVVVVKRRHPRVFLDVGGTTMHNLQTGHTQQVHAYVVSDANADTHQIGATTSCMQHRS